MCTVYIHFMLWLCTHLWLIGTCMFISIDPSLHSMIFFNTMCFFVLAVCLLDLPLTSHDMFTLLAGFGLLTAGFFNWGYTILQVVGLCTC